MPVLPFFCLEGIAYHRPLPRLRLYPYLPLWNSIGLSEVQEASGAEHGCLWFLRDGC